MNIVTEIKNFVEKECNKPSSKYGSEPFEFHFVPMVKYALKLSDEFKADREVIEIAAWLHDIGSIIDGRESHHISGAIIAEKKLQELNYPKEKIELVKKCILHHRGSISEERQSIEEKVIAEADAMSNFDNVSGIFKAAFVYEGLNQGAAKDSVRKKLQNKYKRLHFKKSKEIIEPKFKAAMLLLK